MVLVKGCRSVWLVVLMLLIVGAGTAAGFTSFSASQYGFLTIGTDGSGGDSIQTQIQSCHQTSCHKYGYYAAVVGAWGVIFALDKEIHDFVQQESLHDRVANQMADVVANVGTARFCFAMVAVLLGEGLLTGNTKGYKAGGELLCGLGVAQGVVQGSKLLFGRLRPWEATSTYQFFKGGTSFPSGHAATSFLIATVIAKNFPRQNLSFIGIRQEVPMVPILSYTAAGLVSLQRLYINAHWGSDVVAGGLVGYGVGTLMTYLGNRYFPKIKARFFTSGARCFLSVGLG
jgi:undecaprenyl-diphosphatase